MARNTQVAADHNAPPITRILAEFVAGHPSRGWSDAVDHEAHRTFLNWLGCAVGAAQPRGRRGRAGRGAGAAAGAAGHHRSAAREGRHGERGAAQRHQLAHLRLRRHAPQDHHPSGRPGGLGRCSRWPSTPARAAAQVIDALVLGIDVACRLGNTVYPEHYDRGWHITGTTGMLGAAAGCARLLGLDADQHADGARHRGVAADRPARAVRHHDQALPSRRRGARRPDVGADGASTASPPARRRSRRRAAGRRWCRPSTRGTKSPTNSASASRSRSTATSPSPAAS